MPQQFDPTIFPATSQKNASAAAPALVTTPGSEAACEEVRELAQRWGRSRRLWSPAGGGSLDS